MLLAEQRDTAVAKLNFGLWRCSNTTGTPEQARSPSVLPPPGPSVPLGIPRGLPPALSRACLFIAPKGTVQSFVSTNCYRVRIPRMAQAETCSKLGTFRLLLFYSKLRALPASKKQMENTSLNVHPCDHSKRKAAPSSLKRLLEKVFSISCK